MWYYYCYWWVPAALSQVCYFTEHYIAYKGMTSHQKYLSINMRDRTHRIHGVCVCVLLLLFLSQNLNTWGMCLCMVISFTEPELEYMETWSMCLCIVASLCELELECMEYMFMCCYFIDWTRTRIHGICVCALFIFCVSWISNIFLHAWLIYCCLTLSEHFSSPLIK